MNANEYPTRSRDVLRYLAKHGVKGVQLFKGPGYFCFEGDATEDWADHTVSVPFLNGLTFDQWLQTFKAMDQNPANSKTVRAARR